MRQRTNAYKQHTMARMESSSVKVTVTVVCVLISLAVPPLPLLSAAFPARRAMKRASRQILTALPSSLFHRVLAQSPWVRSARVLSAVGVSCGCSSDRGRPDEPFW